MSRPVLRTSLCDFLGIEYPIVLAGMGGRGLATPPRLVAAVSNAGGPGVRVVLDERVAVFAAGLGDPAWVVPLARKQGMKTIGPAGAVRNAVRHARVGVDVVVAQGHEAGGHTGKIANFPLVPQVVDAVRPTPGVAGGGPADGRGVAAALARGAAGVWVGTAFLVANECDIPDKNKERILLAASEDFVVSRSFTGTTARSCRNPIVR